MAFYKSEEEIKRGLFARPEEENKPKVAESGETPAQEGAAAPAQAEPQKEKLTIDFLKQNGIDVQSGIDILGDEDTYMSMLAEFHRTIRDRFSALIEYKASKDFKKYSMESYSLKSDANYFGFTKLYELAKEHEIKSSEENFDYIVENFKEYEDEIVRIMNVLNTYYS